MIVSSVIFKRQGAFFRRSVVGRRAHMLAVRVHFLRDALQHIFRSQTLHRDLLLHAPMHHVERSTTSAPRRLAEIRTRRVSVHPVRCCSARQCPRRRWWVQRHCLALSAHRRRRENRAWQLVRVEARHQRMLTAHIGAIFHLSPFR